MNLKVIADCSAQFTGFGSEFTQKSVGFSVLLIGLQEVNLTEERLGLALEPLVVVHAFFHPGFCLIRNSEIAVFDIPSFDFAYLCSVFCSKGFQHAVLHETGEVC